MSLFVIGLIAAALYFIRQAGFVFVVSVDSLDPIAISQDPSLSLSHKSPNMDHTTLTKKGVKDKTENLT